jgi:two-component system, NtrC family, nitrogen regulation sensor histidine kinase NtrY
VRTGAQGDRLDYLVRQGDDVRVYSEDLGVPMDRLSRQIGDARRLVEDARERDLRRGFRLTYILLAASFWLVSLALLVFLAHHVSRPIQQLTEGLSQLAAGDLNARVPTDRDDEVGRAIQGLQRHGHALQESTERLVYLGQMASWQTLARKMAHEVKNSLTPIRLTVEEMLARYQEADRGFMAQATAHRGG